MTLELHRHARTLAVAAALVLSSSAVLAQNAPKPVPKPVFEFEAGGGAEWGRLATVGPYANLSTNVTSAHPAAAQAELRRQSGVFEAHTLFRPQTVQPLGVSAYRLDVRYSRGAGDTADAFRKDGVGTTLQIPSVDGFMIDAVSAAASSNVSSSVQQDRTSWRVKPSLVWERSFGGIETAARFGGGYASMRQNETISVRGTDPAVFTTQADVTTTGALSTSALGLVAGFDLRAPIHPALALILATEANLDFARTNYDGSTVDNTHAQQSRFIGHEKNHVLSELRASAGLEWKPLANWSFKVMGDGGRQSGVARIVYPQYANTNSGIFLSSKVDGPAHIETENCWFYGARASALLRF